jgi:hypothetical protein
MAITRSVRGEIVNFNTIRILQDMAADQDVPVRTNEQHTAQQNAQELADTQPKMTRKVNRNNSTN